MKVFFLLILLTQTGFAQQFSISGIVKDKSTGNPVLFAHIYIANTTQGTTSDSDGRFRIDQIPEGRFTLICTMVGYESYLQIINALDADSMEITIELIPSSQVLDEIELKGQVDKKWRRQFKIFERELFGDVPNAARCEIMNPWVVDFETQGLYNNFHAHADQPLIIHNKILGYKISFLLKRFEIEQDQLLYVGFPGFEPLDVKDWDSSENFFRNREDTFKGSTRHFFYALIFDRLKEEGFKVYRATQKYDEYWPNRLSDAVNGGYLRQLEASEIIVGKDYMGNYKIYTDDFIEIIYSEKIWGNSPYQDAPYEVSRLKLNDQLVVASHGYIFNPFSFVVYGYLSEERVANMLPYEYGIERISH